MPDYNINKWVYAECDTTYPKELDMSSSDLYGYIRRNIEPFERTDSQGHTITGYTYEEYKCDKSIVQIIYNQINNESRLNDIENVLADIICG